MSLEALKARAYDLLVLIEKYQQELQRVNQAIKQEMAKPKVEAVPEEKRES
jgi:hypothetical protein